jgi:ApaG protein
MNDNRVATVADIEVSVVSDYLAQQSIEAEQQFVFSYTVTVTNNSDETVQLLSRYW